MLKKIFKAFYGAFLGKDGLMSTTKVLSFLGFICFLLVSFFILWKAPEQFDYQLFAVIAGGGGTSLRAFDKWLNVKEDGKPSDLPGKRSI